MYSSIQLAFRYLHYWFKAVNGKGHGMHSPFVFSFITRILNDRNDYSSYDKVESMRKSLLKDDSPVEVVDLGAGSSNAAGSVRSVAAIAKYAAKPQKWGKLLYRIVRYYQPIQILELGTSLGISSAYLASGHEKAILTTLEGAPQIAEKAKKNFEWLGLRNIHQITGNFDELLPVLLREEKIWDLVFVDGNHRKEPTLRYFEWILGRTGPGSMIIFDDIHWSSEMEEAWDQIRSDPRVRCSLDLFYMGIVFFREEFHEKLDFSIRT